MRKLKHFITGIIGIFSLLLATGCKMDGPSAPVFNSSDPVVTEYDPRDTDQCEHQTDLAWCKAECSHASRSWCAETGGLPDADRR